METPKLRPYQEYGVQWLKEHRRAILADEKRVGKTPQALMAVTEYPLLILSSRNMMRKWEREFYKWVGPSQVANLLMDGIDKRRDVLRTKPEIVIANYDMLGSIPNKAGQPKNTSYRPLVSELTTRQWGGIVIDEAHHLKGRQAMRTKGAFRLKSKDMFLLTANPVANKPEDVWPLLHMIDPKRFSSFWRWASAYCTIEQQYWGSSFPTQVVTGWKDATSIQELLSEYMLRRTMQEVYPDMPNVQFETIPVHLSEEERRRYNLAEHELLLQLADNSFSIIPSAMVASTRLRQLLTCPHVFAAGQQSSKQDVALELVLSLLDETQVVVFSWFKQAAHRLGDALVKAGVTETRSQATATLTS